MLCKILLLQALAACTLADLCWRNTSCSGPSVESFPGSWSSNIFAPTSRTVRPTSFFSLTDVSKITEFTIGNSSAGSIDVDDQGFVFDFGVEVGGIVTVNYTLTGSSTTLGLAFSEARNFIGKTSDNSNGGSIADGALTSNIETEGSGSYTIPDAQLRGGFRYLTLFQTSSSNSTLTIDDITLEISFQPTWSNLRAYQGYFQCNEELLNKVWYSGAYTLQTNSCPGNAGRAAVKSRKGWINNEYIGPGDTVLLDGAKRDRWVWIGDMGTAVPSAFVSTGDLESTKNALQAIYSGQASTGVLPKAGPPYLSKDSETYHLWTLIGTYNYFLYSGDEEFLESIWPQYTKALNYTLGHLTSAGIVKVFWDEDFGAFKESPGDITLYPQDANSMAIAFGVVPANSDLAKRVSDYLESNWTPIGPACPELPKNVSPFVSSIELLGHFQAGRPDRALKLMRDSWGWYLNNPNGTESTVVEGFLVDGSWGYRGDRGYRNDPSYVSHAHGWSSGPTSTLSEYMLGLRVTKPQGQEWRLAPASFTELSEVQGGFTTSLGCTLGAGRQRQNNGVDRWLRRFIGFISTLEERYYYMEPPYFNLDVVFNNEMLDDVLLGGYKLMGSRASHRQYTEDGDGDDD
ncbi:hypothetical protein G7Z17_g548 [Cylindrodendrum hubeiense]|uniref:Alpha-L-rhamnosidase six-hairpin glycosidase domain-containing protein n=1 Tax=Cylindrodendrum hubeiense TaxID=595255 RepID=A0A9P5HK33_9HYPO|nr:hypothetical protein G7Z17_g548 [Cylindrodendrum hubeiense]